MPQQAHMFVDNSNLIGGAQRAGYQIERAPWPAVRIYWRNFFELIEADHLPATRAFAGSLPPGNDDLWEYARRYGYDTSLLRKVEKDDGHLGEQAVDEVLHAKIAGVLLDYDPPQRLVLVTGDGNESDYGTSFLQQVNRAVKHGWTVDIVSWDCQLSRRFKTAAASSKGRVRILRLEDLYHSITFLCEGDYLDDNKNRIHVPRRIVAPLPRGQSASGR